MSALVEINASWKFVFMVFVVALFATIISFDMLSHWDTKRREDLRILLFGVGGLGVLISALTSINAPSFILNFLVIGLLVISGLLAGRENFDTGSKPVELYLIAYGSLAILLISVLWWYFFSESGQYVRSKGKKVKEFTSDKIDNFNEFRKERRMKRQERMKESSMTKPIPTRNPLFEDDNE